MLREKRGWMVPMVYAAALSAAVAVFLLPQLLGPGLANSTRDFGGFLVGLVAVLQTIVLLVAAPLVGASTVAGERERSTWLTLLASPVPRWQISTGKIVAAALYVSLLLSVSAPVAALALLLGAIDLPTLAGLYLSHALLGLTLVCLGVAASTLFRRSWTAALVSIGLSLAGAVFTWAAYGSAAALTHSLSPSVDLGWTYEWLLWFNPIYGQVLFLGGVMHLASATTAWWGHFGALLLVAACSAAFAALRMERLRD